MTEIQLCAKTRVWTAAADDLAIYLVSENEQGRPDGWLSGPLRRHPGWPLRSVAHRTVQGMLRDHGEFDAVMSLHSTSWIEEDDAIVLDYIVVLGGFGKVDRFRGDFEYVRDVWPRARPFTFEVSDELGQPPSHGAADLPDPRYFDLFRNAIGHMRRLRDINSNVRAALDPHWHRHLDAWEERLAGQYEYELTA